MADQTDPHLDSEISKNQNSYYRRRLKVDSSPLAYTPHACRVIHVCKIATLHFCSLLFGVSGRIRTYDSQREADLQSAGINHSPTDTLKLLRFQGATRRHNARVKFEAIKKPDFSVWLLCVLLGWISGLPVSEPRVTLGRTRAHRSRLSIRLIIDMPIFRGCKNGGEGVHGVLVRSCEGWLKVFSAAVKFFEESLTTRS